MDKRTKLLTLLGVLAAVCLAAFLVSRHETKVEQIKNSGEEVLSLSEDSVTGLTWTVNDATLAFHKGDAGWQYDEDVAFPVNEGKIGELLEDFSPLTAAFQIENVDDYGQYGLDSPVCTITLETESQDYTIKLGDYSQMDSQRYITVNDGDVYLVEKDPLDDFDLTIRDMIQNDDTPYIDTAAEITFSGIENATITYQEDGGSLLSEDVYYLDGKPLDSDNIRSFLDSISGLELEDYVTYQAAEDLSQWGMDEPELTAVIRYTDREDEEQTFTLHLSRNREALEAERQKEDGDISSVAAYARVGDSQIIYRIRYSIFEALEKVSYNDLRHKDLFAADFADAREITVTLDGESNTLTYQEPEDDSAAGTWYLGENEVDITELNTQLNALAATEFLTENPTGKQELSLKIRFESGETRTITLYRRDAESCLAEMDGAVVGLTARKDAVNLIEAINGIILKEQSNA